MMPDCFKLSSVFARAVSCSPGFSVLDREFANGALANSLSKTLKPGEQETALANTLDNLKQSGIISAKEQRAINTLFKTASRSTEFQSQIDKKKRLILQYMPIVQALQGALIEPGGQPEAEGANNPLAQESVAYVAKASYRLGNTSDGLKQVYIPCVFIALNIILANILLSIVLSKIVIGPLKILNNATKEIAAGNLKLRVNLPTGDEIEEVAKTFNEMTAALVRMKERAQNAN